MSRMASKIQYLEKLIFNTQNSSPEESLKVSKILKLHKNIDKALMKHLLGNSFFLKLQA